MTGLAVDPLILLGMLTPIYYFQFKQTREMTAVSTKMGLCKQCPVTEVKQ